MTDPNASSTGCFEGYASVFNTVDNGNDVIVPGAFSKALTLRKPGAIKLLWQHDPRQPIGIIEELKEDARGLYVRGRLLLDVVRAQEAHSLLKAGVLDGLSIGFFAVKADRDAKSGVRTLREIDLWEVSLVTFPMNPRARIARFKGATAHEVASRIRTLTQQLKGLTRVRTAD